MQTSSGTAPSCLWRIHYPGKFFLTAILCFSLLSTGCSDRWISVALADLPVLTQMALNIATLAATLDGRQVNPSDATAVQSISAEASRDLNLLESLYNDYKKNPNSATLQEIESGIATINQSLPALLQSAHISDPALSSQVTAAGNLILTTVSSFAVLIPQTESTTGQRSSAMLPVILNPAQLKKQWNQQVCGQSGKPDGSRAACVVR